MMNTFNKTIGVFTLLACAKLSLALDTPIDFAKHFKAKDACFLLYSINQQKVLQEFNPQHCAKRMSPNSTFKIPLSLMAFDQKIINQNTVFKWDGKDKGMKDFNQDQTPHSWLKYSAVWVSQELTPQLGLTKINAYLHAFHYGNEDFSGMPGTKGLTQAWLENSLQISPLEQLDFLKAFALKQLPLSKESMAATKDNLYLMQTTEKWRLYGKTGSGRYLQSKKQNGWFIGFLEKDQQVDVFVVNFTDLNIPEDKEWGGKRAKAITLSIFTELGY